MSGKVMASDLEGGVIAARCGRILTAAKTLFGLYGYRRVTMEAAAEAAQVAKATLYSCYRNKDALFEAVARRLAKGLVRDFTAALEDEGPIRDHARRALIGKHARIFQAVRGSPHAQELFSAKGRLAEEIFQAADREMIAALGSALGTDRAFAARHSALARALFFGAQGLADQCTALSTVEADVGGFVDIHLAGATRFLPAPRAKGHDLRRSRSERYGMQHVRLKR